MQQIILYSDDINLLSHWEKALKKEQYAYTVVDDIESLQHIKGSLVIVNYESLGKAGFSIIRQLVKQQNYLLLLHRTPNIKIAKSILGFGIIGYGNALMRDHLFKSAIETLKENMIWLAPEITSQLIIEIPSSDNENEEDLLSPLSKREKEVALLLKDGLTYNEIADRLNISARTVKAHAQAIYKKLGVSDRIGLALLLR